MHFLILLKNWNFFGIFRETWWGDKDFLDGSHFFQWTVYPTGTFHPMDTSSNGLFVFWMKCPHCTNVSHWTKCPLDEVFLKDEVSIDEMGYLQNLKCYIIPGDYNFDSIHLVQLCMHLTIYGINRRFRENRSKFECFLKNVIFVTSCYSERPKSKPSWVNEDLLCLIGI